MPLRSASFRSPTDFLAISTAPERDTRDWVMRDGMAPVYEADEAEKETAADSMVCVVVVGGDTIFGDASHDRASSFQIENLRFT